ncbi:hypothetical protein E2C01_098195 [Portunus trituberculatus]|uniref:Transmembrane protein n=1 Tax=Portunus trituberculatus TaxID=210409 RepID=A0A5B7JX66_PORTR|nr:hypothetical protein [Portunus trituberculatus]
MYVASMTGMRRVRMCVKVDVMQNCFYAYEDGENLASVVAAVKIEITCGIMLVVVIVVVVGVVVVVQVAEVKWRRRWSG